MGPLNNAQQKNLVEKIVDDARSSGATVTTLGQRLDSALGPRPLHDAQRGHCG